MSYKSDLQQNNADLRDILDDVKALPDKEGGGGAEPVLQEKSVTPTKSPQTVEPDEDYDGLLKVNVDAIPDEYITPTGTKEITENGTHDVTQFESVSVNVQIPEGYIIPTGTKEITENGTHDVTQFESVSVNVAGSGGGGGEDALTIARSIIDKSVEQYSDSEVMSVGGYAFYNCDKITSVNVPKATSLGDYVFCSCAILSDVNIPLVTSIAQYAFNACIALTAIEGNSVTSIGNYTFAGCSALVSVNFPMITSVGAYAFQNCTLLESFDGENVTTVGNYAFTGCSALAEINLPKATSIGTYAFNGCLANHISLPSLKSMSSGAFRGSRFVTVDLPLVTNIANNGFRAQGYIQSVTFPSVTSTSSEAMRNCPALTYVDLPKCASFGTFTFCDCTNLETLILRKSDKICPLSNVNVLQSTKIAAGTGYIYVPAALINSYKSATNWTTFSAQFRALEDYTVDGTITGALDESKI